MNLQQEGLKFGKGANSESIIGASSMAGLVPLESAPIELLGKRGDVMSPLRLPLRTDALIDHPLAGSGNVKARPENSPKMEEIVRHLVVARSVPSSWLSTYHDGFANPPSAAGELELAGSP